MENRKLGSCTTILVGKDASLSGSTLIARNEDSGSDVANPQRFVVVQPQNQPTHYQSVQSTVNFDLPANPLRYTATPDASPKYGIWGGSGINSENVAMTATETITTNSRILGLDPLVKNGIGEEDLLTITLPYIESAKAGVLRLGALIEEYGTYESNGIAFSDINEVWYFETLGGHHWAAIRIPDDSYVVAPNRLNIDDFDFDSDETLFSMDLPDFVEKNKLNPDTDQFNLRHIFGSSSIKDTKYNNPRAWYGQMYFNPELEQDPEDQDLPFILRPARKISIEDIKFVLTSHYQNTPFDPYGTGSEDDKKRYRAIGLNRNQEVHVLEIRNNVPAEIAAVQWLAFGPNTFNALLPFYTNINDTPLQFRDTPVTFDFNYVYWISRATALLGDSNFLAYNNFAEDFEQKIMSEGRFAQAATDKNYAENDDVADYLTKANKALADNYFAAAVTMYGQMAELGSSKMKLRFNLKD